MMTLPVKKSLLFGIIVFSFCLSILYLDMRSENYVIEKQKNLINENLIKLKKEHITDIVSSVHIAAASTLNAEYKRHQRLLQNKSQQFQLLLNSVPAGERCPLLPQINSIDNQFDIAIFHNEKLICESASSIAVAGIDNTKNISSTAVLTDDMEMTVSLSQTQIINAAQKKITSFIRIIEMQNPDTYVWVNEIHNYEGGVDYATRKIHPNLPQTEGLLLSTKTPDIKGNFPYQVELEGINNQGEIFFEYYFKRQTNNEIVKKLAYAKLFKPFDWVIATGIYIDDLELTVEQEINELVAEQEFYNKLVSIVAFFLSVLLVICLYVIEKNTIKNKERELALRHKKQDVKNYRQVLSSMLDLVERRDSYTAGHTKRVARYAVLIAEEMGFSHTEVEILFESAVMHDIGKISTPDTILLKPGKLNSQEYKIIQQHLDSGYQLLSSIKAFKKHAEIIRCHHEHYDGTGYPRGLKGDEICPLSHILILVDAFDAMTSKRIYKTSKTKAAAIEEIKALAGKQFCPVTVKAALPVLEKINLSPVGQNYLKDEFEEARLAYYYKDPLTSLYNYRYLEHIISLNDDPFEKHYRCCYFISLLNFSQYNKKYGWLEGDEQLIRIAKKLTEFLPKAMIFRVFGDDFIIITEQHTHLDRETIEAQLELTTFNIGLELNHLDIDEQNIHGVSQFSETIKKFMST
ncbi:HD domain-containing phosphohydrolase [Shewanella donghaensis]|uniref:HD domain-containing phosphohydrolase n=1 Tax=Shewanella donghaensis TaxID=238836 RepID=UPI0011844279|nr:HD domain-containing phosphohydrolase [Shewanella donghaensis]